MNDVQIGVDEAPLGQEEGALDEKEALRQSIGRNEAELRDAVEELTAAVKSEVTLGGQIIERPGPWLLGGFVIGFLLSWRRRPDLGQKRRAQSWQQRE